MHVVEFTCRPYRGDLNFDSFLHTVCTQRVYSLYPEGDFHVERLEIAVYLDTRARTYVTGSDVF